MMGLPSLHTLDEYCLGAQRARIWLGSEPADMRCGFSRELAEGGILNEVREHAFPLAIRRGWISPEPREVRRHGAEPRADRIVED